MASGITGIITVVLTGQIALISTLSMRFFGGYGTYFFLRISSRQIKCQFHQIPV